MGISAIWHQCQQNHGKDEKVASGSLAAEDQCLAEAATESFIFPFCIINSQDTNAKLT